MIKESMMCDPLPLFVKLYYMKLTVTNSSRMLNMVAEDLKMSL
jgi:hypothetical protein